jgi:hypothetical protein
MQPRAAVAIFKMFRGRKVTASLEHSASQKSGEPPPPLPAWFFVELNYFHGERDAARRHESLPNRS